MIRAIYFDAIGTLIHPEPGAAVVYAEIGKRHGSRYGREQISARFAAAFRQQEEIDRAQGWTTSECREYQRWRDIVAEVLDDVPDPGSCFAELYDHFARPSAWACETQADELLADLRKRRITIGVASNYDHRLRSVVAGMPALRGIQHIVISSEVGWRKPAPQFFAALCQQAGVPAAEILYVGDDRINDYEGARAAGLQALLVNHTDHNSSLAFSVRSALGERYTLHGQE